MVLTAKEKMAYRRGVHFQQIREEMLERTQKTCECCGVKKPAKKLHCHHIDELKYKEEDEKDYLILLCSECHMYIERKIKVVKNKNNKIPVDTLRFLSRFSVEAKQRLEEDCHEKV